MALVMQVEAIPTATLTLQVEVVVLELQGQYEHLGKVSYIMW
jgi:hypothetical protein